MNRFLILLYFESFQQFFTQKKKDLKKMLFIYYNIKIYITYSNKKNYIFTLRYYSQNLFQLKYII